MPTKKAKKIIPKPNKERATNYDERLTINGKFEDLVKELITPNNQPKKK